MPPRAPGATPTPCVATPRPPPPRRCRASDQPSLYHHQLATCPISNGGRRAPECLCMRRTGGAHPVQPGRAPSAPAGDLRGAHALAARPPSCRTCPAMRPAMCDARRSCNNTCWLETAWFARRAAPRHAYRCAAARVNATAALRIVEGPLREIFHIATRTFCGKQHTSYPPGQRTFWNRRSSRPTIAHWGVEGSQACCESCGRDAGGGTAALLPTAFSGTRTLIQVRRLAGRQSLQTSDLRWVHLPATRYLAQLCARRVATCAHRRLPR